MNVLIINASILTQNKRRKYISRGFIVIKKDKITEVCAGDLKHDYLKKGYKVINAEGLLILPGFINAHVHLGESIFQGLFKCQYSLEDYLNVTEKITSKTSLVEKKREVVADYSLLNLLRSGTTTICGGRVANSANRWGIRNVSGYMVMNSYKLKMLSVDLEKQYSQDYNKTKSISHPAIFIHSLNKINIDRILPIRKILKKFTTSRLILHIAETKTQEEEIVREFGMSSVEFLRKNNLLNNKTILVHGNWFTKNDLKLIKKYRSSVVQCLSSNINVADKVLNLVNVMGKNIKSCLATDGSVTGGTFSVLNEARRCFLYYQRNGQSISQQKCLDLITIGAAKVLGLDHIIGSIEKGKKADLVFCKIAKAGKTNILDKIKGVEGLMIDGVIKIWEHKLVGFNDKLIINKFNNLSAKVHKIYEHFSYEK